MYTINRSAVIIKPKQPMLDWINHTDSERKFTIEDISKENSTLLIPQFDSFDGARDYVKKNYEAIFEFELFGWYIDEDLWPRKRTYEMFNEWFDIQINSEVFDLVDEEIEKEEM